MDNNYIRYKQGTVPAMSDWQALRRRGAVTPSPGVRSPLNFTISSTGQVIFTNICNAHLYSISCGTSLWKSPDSRSV